MAGYFALGWAFKKFEAHGQMKENQTQVFSLEKNLTEEEKKHVEEFKKTLDKEDLAALESVKKDFAVPRKDKRRKKDQKPVMAEDIQRMHEFDELSTFAEGVVKDNPNFNPCESICVESTLRTPTAVEGEEGDGDVQVEVEKPRGDFMKRIKEYYAQSEDVALKDPAFNYVVLFMANLRGLMPKDFTDFMFNVVAKDPKAIESDPWLKAKLLVQMPIWLYRMKEGMQKAEDRHLITKNFMELHQSCKKGKIQRKEAHRQCVQLFDNYGWE